MKLNKLKMNIPQIIMSLILALVLAILFTQTTVFAGLAESARGFAWGGTSSSNGAYQGMGWISMNSLDGGGANYGVNIPSTDGNLSGHAWSEHYGWISFNGSDLSGCSPALSQARRTGNSIVGGARILASAGSNSGGFDGCVSLAGSGYGITINGSISPYSLAGYAWSSDLGWINFSGTRIEFEPSATISVTGCTIPIGASTCNASLTWDINDSPNPNVINQTTGTQYSTNPNGSNVSVAISYGTQTIAARDNTTVLDSKPITINCAGIGQWNSGKGACIDPRPNLTEPSITHTPSAGFDPATGAYNSVAITFQTTNDGGGSTGIAPQYKAELDEGQNGYDDEQNGSLGIINVEQSSNRTVTFTNVMFGNTRARVKVDSTEAVEEINESDNDREFSFTLPPPDPGLSIEADRTLVRPGDQVTLTWSTEATYISGCTVKGPAGVNESGLSGSITTGPITAKSEFIFSCTNPTVFTETEIVEVTGTPQEV